MTTGVSIVIPTWNAVALLKRFLPSVINAATNYSRQFHAPTEIIVSDDGSTDDTLDWLSREGFREQGPGAGDLVFVKNETNRGFGEASNRGFAAARFPLVFLLNNDVEPDPNSLAPLVGNFKDPHVFAVHCRVFDFEQERECGTGKLGSFAHGFIRVHRSYAAPLTGQDARVTKDDARESEPLYSMFAGGGSAMFDREKFLEIGGFEPLFAPFYWEDVELSYRAWKRGYTVLYEPRSVTRHLLSSTIGKFKRRKVRQVDERNRLIYHWIHLHDTRMLVSHALWVLTLAVTAPLRLKPGFISSLAAALRMSTKIRNRRREERRAARRGDRDIFNIFAELKQRGDIFVYDDYDELEKWQEQIPSRTKCL